MKCSCVWLVVSVGAHNIYVECVSFFFGGVPYIYIYMGYPPSGFGGLLWFFW